MILKNRIYELKNKNNKDNLSITAKLLNNEKRKRANRQRATEQINRHRILIISLMSENVVKSADDALTANSSQ